MPVAISATLTQPPDEVVKQAIQSFERDHGLNPDGIVDRKLLEQLSE